MTYSVHLWKFAPAVKGMPPFSSSARERKLKTLFVVVIKYE